MPYESEFYSRRPYTSSYTSTRPTVSSYTLTSPISVVPTYTRIAGYSRPSFKFSYDDDYPTELPSYNRYMPVPMTRVTTSPMRVYRERVSPVRVITPSARIYRRDAYSPVRVITSPARVCSIRVRPSVLSREFDRIERKHRSSPLGFEATEEFLNSPYTSAFNDETRDIRASTKRLLRECNEPLARAPSVPRQFYNARVQRATSAQPSSKKLYSRFDSDTIPDKYGDRDIENEVYVNRNILRPTRKTRDRIELLSQVKFRELPKRYSATILDPARPSRKFNEPVNFDDPAEARKEVQALKASARLERVKEADEDLEKIKQKRLEERQLREERALMEEKVKKEEQAKKEEAERQAEIQRQDRIAAQAASELKAIEEAKLAEEARIAEQERLVAEAEAAKIAEEKRSAKEAAARKSAEKARVAEEARLAEEAAKKAEEEAARLAEETRLAELEKLKEEELKLAELEKIAKEEEEVELARQANELAELARQQELELQQQAVEEAPVSEEPAVEEEQPIVEEPIEEVVEDTPVEETPAEPEVIVEEEEVAAEEE